jgi:hypothetical protein
LGEFSASNFRAARFFFRDPMKITYTLSNRQKKALLISGESVLLALPAPPIEIDDELDWAKSVLPADLRSDAKSAAIEEISVKPRANRATKAMTLTELIGEIAEAPLSGTWLYAVVAVVVRLEHGQTRRKGAGIQWPANVLLDGKPLLSSEEP